MPLLCEIRRRALLPLLRDPLRPQRLGQRTDDFLLRELEDLLQLLAPEPLPGVAERLRDEPDHVLDVARRAPCEPATLPPLGRLRHRGSGWGVRGVRGD